MIEAKLNTSNNQKLFLITIFLVFSNIVNSQTKHFKDSLDYAVQLMIEEKNFNSIKVLERLSAESSVQRHPKEKFLVANNIGINYFELLDYGEALKYYQEAYRIAVDQFDEESEMIVLNNIGFLYFKNKKYEESEKYFLRAIDIAKSKNNKAKIAMYSINAAMLYNKKNQLDKALDYLAQAHRTNINNSERINAEYDNLLIENHFLAQNYSQSEQLANAFLTQYDPKTYKDLTQDVYLNLAKINSIADKNTNAKKWLEKLLLTKPDLAKKIEALSLLSLVEYKANNFKESLALKDSTIQLNDKLNDIKNGKLFALHQNKLEQKEYQYQLNLEKGKLRNQKIIFFSIAIALVLLVWALFNYTTKMRQKKIIAEKNQKIVELQLEQKKRDLIVIQEAFHKKQSEVQEEKIYFQNKIEESHRKLASQDIMIQNTHQIIDDFVESIKEHESVTNIPQLNQKIKNLKNKLVQKENQISFLKHFEEANPRFIQNTHNQFPNLNANDYRFLIYLSMNLSLKEIASILNISIEACKKRKERIAKKMDISSNEIYNKLIELQ